ncbi:MAG TPA: tetratricopeptide repeat protein [Thermoanaerobaculia bacterium]|jgi:Tfp pilus assembly protein PilF
MRLNTILAVLLLVVSTPLAATTVRGVIIAKELGGPGIANVRVSGVGCASPTRSFADGTFVLEFPNKQPGDKVQLIVDMPGMVVVNRSELRFNLPKEPSNDPLIFLLCGKVEIEECRLQYYQVNKTDKIEQSYREKLAELQAKNQATEEAKEQLRIERDRAREAERRALEQLARVHVEEVPEFYANPTYSGYRSDAAMALNALGIKCRSQNQMKEAREAFEEALEISRKLAQENPDTYLPDVAETLNNLGSLLSDQNLMQEAQDAYDEALEIGLKLKQKDPPTYLPIVASTQNNLGILFRKQNRMEDARKAFGDALYGYRELRRQNPDTYETHVAKALNNLGAVNYAWKRIEEGELRRQNSDIFEPHVAEALNSLGVVKYAWKRIEEAQNDFIEAFAIYRALARKNPGQYGQEVKSTYDEALDVTSKLVQQSSDTYLPDVAMLHKNLGTLYYDQGRTEEAWKYFIQALAIYKNLARLSRDHNLLAKARGNFREVLAIYENFGRETHGQYAQELEATYDESLAVSRELAQDKPDYYRPEVAMMLRELGILKRDQGRIEEARKDLSESLAIYEDLEKQKEKEKKYDIRTSENEKERTNIYRSEVEFTRKLLDDLGSQGSSLGYARGAVDA